MIKSIVGGNTSMDVMTRCKKVVAGSLLVEWVKVINALMCRVMPVILNL